MDSINILKTNYNYCLIENTQNDPNLFLDSASSYEGRQKDNDNNQIDIVESNRESTIKEEELSVFTMILFSLPSFGKMSTILMLK